MNVIYFQTLIYDVNRFKIMSQIKLSTQQKEILSQLCESELSSIKMGDLSKNIAKKKGIIKNIDDFYYSSEHRSHVASFSRSISRLEKRGLINKIYNPINIYDYNYRMKKLHPKPEFYVHKDRATDISLTDKGAEFCEIQANLKKLDEFESNFDKTYNEIKNLLLRKIK